MKVQMKLIRNNKDTLLFFRNILALIIFTCLNSCYLFAQFFPDSADVMSPISESERLILDEEELGSTDLDTVFLKEERKLKPRIGINFYRDLNFQTAYEKHYDQNYGALVGSVKEAGAADLGGILQGDIITKFSGERVFHNDHFIRLIKKKQVGERIPVTLFRDGKYCKTNVILQPDGKLTDLHEKETEEWKKSRIFYGDIRFGPFNWIPIWYMPDWSDLTEFFGEIGFSEVTSDYKVKNRNYKGIYLNGFQFVGDDEEDNGITGIIWASNSFHRNIKNDADVSSKNKQMDYHVGFWGITYDRGFPIMDRFIIYGGATIGLGGTSISLYKTDGTFNWNELNNHLLDTGENYLKLEKKYYLIQPRLTLALKFSDNFGIQSSVGYMYGFPRHKGWNIKAVDKEFYIKDSPETSFSGYTFSLGPWFNLD